MNNIVGSAKTTMLVMAAALLTAVGAAAANDTAVCFDAWLKAQWSRAAPACTKAAKQGDKFAQTVLGLMYDEGLGVAKNYKEAVKWYRLAAAQGDADAQHNLGLMYNNGQGVAQDYKEAVKWYRLAAEQGHALAQNNLGLMYGVGQGVAQDYVRAHMWLNIAAVSGNANSVKGRELTAGKMTREQIARAQDMARQCIAKDYKAC